MSLIIRSSELAWLLQLNFKQPHTYVHEDCYSDTSCIRVCSHTLSSSSQLQELEDSNSLLEHNDVWSYQTPNRNRPEKEGADGFPQPFSKSLLRNVSIEYVLLVSQSLGEDSPLSCVVGDNNHRKSFTLDVYSWQTNRSN